MLSINRPSAKLSLQMARELAGHSIENVAMYTGVSIEALEKYETDSSEMPIKIAVKLLVLYQVTANSICFN